MTEAPASAGTGDGAFAGGRLLVLWLLGGLLFVAPLDVAPLTRTQEARVLETGREMVGRPLLDWLIPRTNGHARLRKPPLAYWLAAGAMSALGAHAWAGRMPFALAAWVTLGITFDIARRMFTRRAGLFAAIALLGTFLFLRLGHDAETDVLSLLFVTAAVYAVWRGWEATHGRATTGWFQLSGAAIGLAVLSKGPPGAYPVIFLLALAAVERRWQPVRWWFRCGAPATAAVIAVPWFLYVARHPLAAEVVDDLVNSAAGGEGHAGWFTKYISLLTAALVPWTPLVVVGVAVAIHRWRQDPRLRATLLWASSILLPLCVWGNKQSQYLLPLMPPLMVLTGYLLDDVLRNAEDVRLRRIVSSIVLGIVAVFGIGAFALPFVGRAWRGSVIPLDFVTMFAAVLVAATASALWFRHSFALGIWACCVGGAVLAVVLTGWWSPSLHGRTTEQVAEQINATFGDGPYAFRHAESLPLVFAMQRVMPVVQDDQVLAASPSAASSRTLLIEVARKDRIVPTPNPQWAEVFRAEADEKAYVVYSIPTAPPAGLASHQHHRKRE